MIFKQRSCLPRCPPIAALESFDDMFVSVTYLYRKEGRKEGGRRKEEGGRKGAPKIRRSGM